jgi:hypothetical protein
MVSYQTRRISNESGKPRKPCHSNPSEAHSQHRRSHQRPRRNERRTTGENFGARFAASPGDGEFIRGNFAATFATDEA